MKKGSGGSSPLPRVPPGALCPVGLHFAVDTVPVVVDGDSTRLRSRIVYIGRLPPGRQVGQVLPVMLIHLGLSVIGLRSTTNSARIGCPDQVDALITTVL